MKRILIPLLVLAVLGACSSHKGVVKTEFTFANKMAKAGLWKEALYRWKKSLAEGKESAAVFNNIAIAMEKMGDFDEAEKYYKKALKIDPNNSTVKGNYEKMQKFLSGEDDFDKDKKKRDKNEKENEFDQI